MSLTKAQLEALNESSFPNNNEGLITPEILRNYNSQSIDNTVNQAAYTADSASFNTRIDNIVVGTGFATTGSNTFYGDQYYNANLHVSGTNYIDFNGGLLRIGEANNGVTLIDAYDGIQIRNFTSNDIQIEQNANGAISLDNNSGSISINAHKAGQAVAISASSIQLNNVDFIPYSQSVDTRINNIVSGTGFATTGSNTFYGNQTLVSSSLSLNGTGQITLPNGFSLQGNATDISQLSAGTTIQFITEPPAGPGGANDIKFINRVSGSQILFSNQQGGAGNDVTFEGGAVNFKIQAASGSTGIVDFWNTPLIQAPNTAITASSINVLNGQTINTTLSIGTAAIKPTIQALPSSTPAGDTGLQVNAGPSGSFSMRTLYGAGVGNAILEAYDTFPTYTQGGKISAKSGGGIDLFGYGGYVTISGSNTTIQGLQYPNADGTNGQVLTTNGSGVLSFTTVSGSGGTLPAGVISGSAQITALGFVSSSVTASSLITASISGTTLTFTKGDNSTFNLTLPTGSASGSISTVGLITTGSASTGSQQAISGGFQFNTTYIVNDDFVSQDGGSNIFYADYGDVFCGYGKCLDFNYWLSQGAYSSMPGVTINGPGVTNATVTGINFSSYLEVTLSSGTVTNGGTYTFTGPAIQIVGITGSLAATDAILIQAPNGNIAQMNQNGFFAQYAGPGAAAGVTPGYIVVADYGVSPSDELQIAISSSYSNNNNTWNAGPFLATYNPNNFSREAIIGFQSDNTWTDGRMTVLTPLVASSSVYINTGSAFPQATGSALVAWNASTGQLTHTTYQSTLASLFDVGAFFSTITQSGSANTSASFQFDNTLPINEITLTSGSHINIPKSAYYNFQFSIQIVQGSGAADVAVWLKKNGSNVADTATYTTIPSNQKSVLALNLWDSGSAGDYYELAYQSDSANTTYAYVAPSGNIPGSPSVILTVNQVR